MVCFFKRQCHQAKSCIKAGRGPGIALDEALAGRPGACAAQRRELPRVAGDRGEKSRLRRAGRFSKRYPSRGGGGAGEPAPAPARAP